MIMVDEDEDGDDVVDLLWGFVSHAWQMVGGTSSHFFFGLCRSPPHVSAVAYESKRSLIINTK
jgi:hypothetical protein